MKYADTLIARAHMGIDVGYLKTLLFPELYNSDVPQPLSTQSYCRFTDKKELTISSGNNGMILWYPKVTHGAQLFKRASGDNLSVGVALDGDTWHVGGFQDYTNDFSQANLVSAAIQIQYIGQLQNEQGYFVGSQIYGTSPSAITVEDIENGQFRVMEKPGDGIRMIYMPKDSLDFNYYQLTKNKAKNNGGRPTGESLLFPSSTTDATKAPKDVQTTSAAPYWAQTVQIEYSKEADVIAIYWKGLANTTAPDLRIDIIRKFNGFPLASRRDILDLQKPRKTFDPKKTIDVVQELQNAIPQLCGHSIKSMDRVSDEIQEFLPNLGHLYNEGALKEGTSLRGFADQLQSLSGMEGPPTVIGRLYE